MTLQGLTLGNNLHTALMKPVSSMFNSTVFLRYIRKVVILGRDIFVLLESSHNTNAYLNSMFFSTNCSTSAVFVWWVALTSICVIQKPRNIKKLLSVLHSGIHTNLQYKNNILHWTPLHLRLVRSRLGSNRCS